MRHLELERWAARALRALEGELAAYRIPVHADRTIVRYLPEHPRLAAQCLDGGTAGFIIRIFGRPGPAEQTHALLHEVLHIAAGVEAGHGGLWAAYAQHLGVLACGATPRGPGAQKIIDAVLRAVPHPDTEHAEFRLRDRRLREAGLR